MLFRLKKAFVKFLSKTRILEYYWRRLPDGIYVFNYHRVGNASKTDYDRAIFSCSADAFDEHLTILKQHFTIVDTRELAQIIERGEVTKQRYAVITFDDGYEDNYSQAFPVLKKHQVPAIFYVATDFIDSTHLPWWDEIAFLLRHSCGSRFHLLSTELSYALETTDIDRTIQQAISAIKMLDNVSTDEVLVDIRRQFPEAFEQLQHRKHSLFMTWPQLTEMSQNGMEIGSHTISHRILAKLTDEEQEKEIRESKTRLERHLQQEIHSIAYPVGRYFCYNSSSVNIAQDAGYQIGFNNEPGYHRSVANQLDLNRFCVTEDNFDFIKFECSFL